jgi:MFS transporter, FHS family, L-fucose permease
MQKQSTRLLVLCCIMFFGLGMVIAGIGPSISELARDSQTDIASLGGIFTMLFLGSLLAQFAGGWLSDRFGRRPILAGGLIFVGVGVFLLTRASTLYAILAFGLVAGIGYGMSDLGGNVTIAEAFDEKKRVSALNWLNLFFGIGAVAGPLFAGLFLAQWKTSYPALWISSLVLILSSLILFFIKSGPENSKAEGLTEKMSFRSLTLWSLAIFLFIYVGIETGLGGWLPTYMEKTIEMAPESSAIIASGFWLAIALGRLITASLGERLFSLRVLAISIGCSLLGAVLLVLSSGQLALTLAGIFFTGLGFGPMFPTTMAVITTRYMPNSGQAAGLAVAFGSLGGMILPYFQGIVMQEKGPTAAVSFPLAGLLMMGIAFHTARKRA